MIIFAPSKINIGLYVTSKRSDGYHNIESVFFPIPLYDVVEIIPSENFKLVEYGIKTNTNFKDNLCYKAWSILHEKYNIPNVEIHLLKNIPSQAGLGGGSSDAVATLKLLNDIFNLAIDDKLMCEIALGLGSDCPFFVKSLPSIVGGRGENIQNIDLSLKNKILLILKPLNGVSTKNAFSKIDIKKNGTLHKDIFNPITDWKNNIKNEFEEICFDDIFELRKVKEDLYRNGALYVSLSGSGSAMYALFENDYIKLSDLYKNYFVFKTILY
jgi:4-diphosphocytidyl-2-C-methyl-D-erythritol kinase